VTACPHCGKAIDAPMSARLVDVIGPERARELAAAERRSKEEAARLRRQRARKRARSTTPTSASSTEPTRPTRVLAERTNRRTT
jgi:hypothetical protein